MEINDFLSKFKAQFADDNSFQLNVEDDFRKIESYDSLTGMAILVMIKDEFGVELTDDEYKSFNSVKSIYDFIILKMG